MVLPSLNMKLVFRLALISGVLLLVWYTYNQGVEAGVNKTVAKYAEVQDEAVAHYQQQVADQADEYNRKLVAIRRKYEAELAEQTEQAKLLAQQVNEASETTTAIRERIRYVESDCSNVGSDAYGLYQRTRRIVSDPRKANPERTEEPITPNQ